MCDDLVVYASVFVLLSKITARQNWIIVWKKCADSTLLSLLCSKAKHRLRRLKSDLDEVDGHNFFCA